MTRDADAVEILVLRDEQGRYYLLPRTVLERARADGAQQAEREAALEAEDAAGFVSLGLSTLTPITQFTASPSPTTAGAGKVTMQDFHFVMKVDKASP